VPGRGESVVYNLSVAQAHTFFVAGEGGDGVWVHNACPRAPASRGAAKAFSSEKRALVDMAKADKRAGGITPDDLQAYKDLNAELPDPFPTNQVRGPEAHPLRTPESTPGPGQDIHGHVGPVDHIPVLEDP